MTGRRAPARRSNRRWPGLVLTKTQWVWVNIRADLTSMVLKKTRREESEQWRDSLPPQLGLRHVQVFLKKPRRAILSIGTRGRYQQHFSRKQQQLVALVPKQRDDSSGLRQGKESIRSSPTGSSFSFLFFFFLFSIMCLETRFEPVQPEKDYIYI